MGVALSATLRGSVATDGSRVRVDAAELRLAEEHVVALEARPPYVEGRGAVAIRDLVRNALRDRLQATQAGNQLLALLAQQLADLTAVGAANGRAQMLTEAERTAAAEQGREQRRRFLTPGSGYQPGNAQMFNGN